MSILQRTFGNFEQNVVFFHEKNYAVISLMIKTAITILNIMTNDNYQQK